MSEYKYIDVSVPGWAHLKDASSEKSILEVLAYCDRVTFIEGARNSKGLSLSREDAISTLKELIKYIEENGG